MRKMTWLGVALAIVWNYSTPQVSPGNQSLSVAAGSVDVGKAKIYYEDAGTGDALIMIHGGYLTMEMWDGHFEKFARRYRTVRYDARNHGRSRSEAATFAHFEDFKKLMDHLKIEKAVIMGLSMGGYIATDFALKYPDRVNGLILVAPGLWGFKYDDAESEAFSKKYKAASETGDNEKIIDVFMEAWTYGPRRKAEDVDATVRNKVRTMARTTFKTWNAQTKELVANPPAAGRLKEIAAPTLAIVGDIDMPSILGIVALMEKDIPHFEKVIIPGVAHMVNLENPEAFDRAVLNFLDKIAKVRKTGTVPDVF